MDIDQFLRDLASNLVGLMALAILGLIFLLVGSFLAIRNSRRALHEPAQGMRARFAVIPGILLCAFVGYVVYSHPEGIEQLFAEDHEDREKLAALQQADLSTAGLPAPVPGEWPQWRGPNRDGISVETGLRWDGSPAALPVVWSGPLGGGYSSPAIVGGLLYVQDRKENAERVVCLEATTGKEIWVYHYPAPYQALRAGYAGGPRATPTVHDGRVYTVGATGVFLCLTLLQSRAHRGFFGNTICSASSKPTFPLGGWLVRR